MRPPRYDAAVLFDVAGPVSISGLAGLLGVHRRQLYRWLHEGVTDQSADHVAVALGRVPYALWPEWIGGTGSEAVTDVVVARQRVAEDRRAAEAERRREAKKTIAAAVIPDRECGFCGGRFTPKHQCQRFCRMACSEGSRNTAKSRGCPPSYQQADERTVGA